METLDLVLSRGRHSAFRRATKANSWDDQENADAAFAGPGARRSGPAQSVCSSSTESRVFIDPAWREPKANPEAYVSVGDKTPHPIRHSEGSSSRTAKFRFRAPAYGTCTSSPHERAGMSTSGTSA